MQMINITVEQAEMTALTISGMLNAERAHWDYNTYCTVIHSPDWRTGFSSPCLVAAECKAGMKSKEDKTGNTGNSLS